VQSATVDALKHTSAALKQYGRTVDVASVDHLLNNMDDAVVRRVSMCARV